MDVSCGSPVPPVVSGELGLLPVRYAPFRYAADQVMTWAGPWVTFRSDSVVMEFKWLSVREVGPQV